MTSYIIFWFPNPFLSITPYIILQVSSFNYFKNSLMPILYCFSPPSSSLCSKPHKCLYRQPFSPHALQMTISSLRFYFNMLYYNIHNDEIYLLCKISDSSVFSWKQYIYPYHLARPDLASSSTPLSHPLKVLGRPLQLPCWCQGLSLTLYSTLPTIPLLRCLPLTQHGCWGWTFWDQF